MTRREAYDTIEAALLRGAEVDPSAVDALALIRRFEAAPDNELVIDPEPGAPIEEAEARPWR